MSRDSFEALGRERKRTRNLNRAKLGGGLPQSAVDQFVELHEQQDRAIDLSKQLLGETAVDKIARGMDVAARSSSTYDAAEALARRPLSDTMPNVAERLAEGIGYATPVGPLAGAAAQFDPPAQTIGQLPDEDAFEFLGRQNGDPIVTEDGHSIVLETSDVDGDPPFERSIYPGDLRPSPRPKLPEPMRSDSASWTGRVTSTKRIIRIKRAMPVAMAEIDKLAHLIEEKRFNDPETIEAIGVLRNIHRDIGEILVAAERGNISKKFASLIANQQDQFLRLLSSAPKMMTVAPAMSLGIAFIFSMATGKAIDPMVAATVFGGLGIKDYADAVRDQSKRASDVDG